MESLKEVLVRVLGISGEEAEERLVSAKELLTEGKTPEEVLLLLYGVEVSKLDEILSPNLQEV